MLLFSLPSKQFHGIENISVIKLIYSVVEGQIFTLSSYEIIR